MVGIPKVRFGGRIVPSPGITVQHQFMDAGQSAQAANNSDIDRGTADPPSRAARRRTVPQQTVDSILTTRRSAAISWSPSEQELGLDRRL
jgi:hypothetical protein